MGHHWVLTIFERHGWITSSLAGRVSANHFALLVQHQTREIQQRLLPALERLSRKGEAPMGTYAYLFDRVQTGLGKPQRWGTQIHCVDREPVLLPVEQRATLDERRKRIGLAPVTEYLGSDYFKQFCSAELSAVPRP